MVHKSLHGLAPDYLCSMFTYCSSITSYSLRDTEGKLAIRKPRTDYLKNSFSYSGAVLWNSLPMDLRQANTLSKFSKRLQQPLPRLINNDISYKHGTLESSCIICYSIYPNLHNFLPICMDVLSWLYMHIFNIVTESLNVYK